MDDLLRAYRLYRRMMRYPHLVDAMRKLFFTALVDAGAVTAEGIRQEALRQIRDQGLDADEQTVRDFSDALIDLAFARHFDREQIENYINLARKHDAFHVLHKVVNTEGVTSSNIKQALKEFCEIPQGSLYVSPSEAEGVRVALINHFVSNQLPFIGVAKKHITIRDIDEMMDHSLWNRRRSGKIGGKAAGVLLAHTILLPRLGPSDPELETFLRKPESYYFNSGILSDFIDYNGLYFFHTQKYKTRESIEQEYADMAHLFKKASFPPEVVTDFRTFLDEVGEHPLILRSSSLLEDSFDFTFSGKYDSVFIPNQGSLQTRLDELIWGVKQVLMSTFNPSAIFYRRDHKLLDFDERMSVLVQKVIGRRFGDVFFPFAAGVAFSHNVVAWTPRIVKEDGLVRLVLGLGTRAVDRVGADYPRMVPLSHPRLRPEVGFEAIRKYSQKMVDVLNLGSGRVETVSYHDLFSTIHHPDLDQAISIDQGGHLAPPLFLGQEIDLGKSCITFDNFLSRTPFVAVMKKALKRLEHAYGCPVEVEFVWDDEKLTILQCRSLAFKETMGKVSLPKDVPTERILFTNDQGISNGFVRDIDAIVYVDPKAYARLGSYEERLAVGRAVGRLNRILEERRYALLGPVRWGSNDINYGVKVGYEDINHTLILGEIAFEKEGSTPEVSFGTHFFNDLVEAQIVFIAFYPNETGTIFREEFFHQAPNLLASLAPDLASHASVVHVIDVPSCTGGQLLQVYQDGRAQQGIGYFDHAERDAEA